MSPEIVANKLRVQYSQVPPNMAHGGGPVKSNVVERYPVLLRNSFCYCLLRPVNQLLECSLEVAGYPFVILDKVHVLAVAVEYFLPFIFKVF